MCEIPHQFSIKFSYLQISARHERGGEEEGDKIATTYRRRAICGYEELFNEDFTCYQEIERGDGRIASLFACYYFVHQGLNSADSLQEDFLSYFLPFWELECLAD